MPKSGRLHWPLDGRAHDELYLVSMMEAQPTADPNLARVRTATLADLPGIVLLMNTVFGPQKQNEEVFTKWIAEDRYSVGVAISPNKEVIGVSTWHTKLTRELTNFEVFGSIAIEPKTNWPHPS